MKTPINKQADLIGKTITGVFGLSDDLVLVMEDSFCVLTQDCSEVELIDGKYWLEHKIGHNHFLAW